jgi:hypothetical protein
MKNEKRDLYHTFRQDDKEARVFLTNEGFEVDYYNKSYLISTEQHHDKSESWAEDCADNYVTGMKKL